MYTFGDIMYTFGDMYTFMCRACLIVFPDARDNHFEVPGYHRYNPVGN